MSTKVVFCKNCGEKNIINSDWTRFECSKCGKMVELPAPAPAIPRPMPPPAFHRPFMAWVLIVFGLISFVTIIGIPVGVLFLALSDLVENTAKTAHYVKYLAER